MGLADFLPRKLVRRDHCFPVVNLAENLPRNGSDAGLKPLAPAVDCWPISSPTRPISSPAMAGNLPRNGRFPPPEGS